MREVDQPIQGIFVSPWILGAFWYSMAIGVICFNKAILSEWDFPYPFFLTGVHQLYGTIATRLLYQFTPLLASVKQEKLSRDTYLKKVIMLALCYALALVLGNSAYKYLSVGYIQMLKSCTPVPTLAASFLLGREDEKAKSDWYIQIGLILIICFGAAVSSVGESHFSMIGFCLMISAICADVLRMSCMDYLTKDVKLDTLSTLYYMAPLAFFFIALGFFFFEADAFFSEGGGADKLLQSSGLVICLFLNATMAMLLNCSIVLFITYAGIMTMSLAGIAKDILTVGLGCLIFRQGVTLTQVGGYSVSLLGLALYREHKRDAENLSSWLAASKREIARQVDLFLCCLKIGQGRKHQPEEEYEMVDTEERDTHEDADTVAKSGSG